MRTQLKRIFNKLKSLFVCEHDFGENVIKFVKCKCGCECCKRKVTYINVRCKKCNYYAWPSERGF